MDSAGGIVETASPRAAGTGALRPWWALAGLWLAFELPAVCGPDGLHIAALRPTGEFLCLVSMYGASRRLRRRFAVRALDWALRVVAAVLVLVRVDRAVYFVLTRSEP